MLNLFFFAVALFALPKLDIPSGEITIVSANPRLQAACYVIEHSQGSAIQFFRCLQLKKNLSAAELISELAGNSQSSRKTCSQIFTTLYNELRIRNSRPPTPYNSNCEEFADFVMKTANVRLPFLGCTSSGAATSEACLTSALGGSNQSQLLRIGSLECFRQGHTDKTDAISKQLDGIEWSHLGPQRVSCDRLIDVALNAGAISKSELDRVASELRGEGPLPPFDEELIELFWTEFAESFGCAGEPGTYCDIVRPDKKRAGPIFSEMQRAIQEGANWVFKENDMDTRMSGDLFSILLSVRGLHGRHCRVAGPRTLRCDITVDFGCKVDIGGYDAMNTIMTGGVCSQLTPRISAHAITINGDRGSYEIER